MNVIFQRKQNKKKERKNTKITVNIVFNAKVPKVYVTRSTKLIDGTVLQVCVCVISERKSKGQSRNDKYLAWKPYRIGWPVLVLCLLRCVQHASLRFWSKLINLYETHIIYTKRTWHVNEHDWNLYKKREYDSFFFRRWHMNKILRTTWYLVQHTTFKYSKFM